MSKNQHAWLSALAAWVVSLGPVAFADDPSYPPKLPDGKSVVTITTDDFLRPAATLREGVSIASKAPTVDFLYFPGQDYPGNPWSAWGDSLATGEVYYASIGDHKAPGGNALVYQYDPASKKLEQIVDVRKLLKLPEGHYTPGKIHSRLDLGRDGWLYFSTHRGSTRITTKEYHFTGDWILRHHPGQGKTEIVAHAPLPDQCMPTGLLDPQRLIFYAGTADGDYRNKRVQFLAYDVANRKVLYSDDHGPYRYLIHSPTSGRVYFHGEAGATSDTGNRSSGQLVRFDPAKPGKPTAIDATVGLRSATQETPQGIVYAVDGDELWAFDTNSERAESLGPLCVGKETYIASIDADPKTGRYLYFVAGAHGGSFRDGSPLVQYDVKTRRRKVIAFLHPALHKQLGYTPLGTYSTAVSPAGDKVYITWNGNRGSDPTAGKVPFNTCALTVVHIPEEERRP